VQQRLDATAKSKIHFGISTAMAHLDMRWILPRDLKQSDIVLNEHWEPGFGEFTFYRLW
jgi:hypothetical protein